jgi:hypothetical protein
MDFAGVIDSKGKPLPVVDLDQQSADELAAFLPAPAGGNLDQQLSAAVQQAIETITQNGDATKATAEYVELLRETRQDLEAARLPRSGLFH